MIMLEPQNMKKKSILVLRHAGHGGPFPSESGLCPRILRETRISHPQTARIRVPGRRGAERFE